MYRWHQHVAADPREPKIAWMSSHEAWFAGMTVSFSVIGSIVPDRRGGSRVDSAAASRMCRLSVRQELLHLVGDEAGGAPRAESIDPVHELRVTADHDAIGVPFHPIKDGPRGLVR